MVKPDHSNFEFGGQHFNFEIHAIWTNTNCQLNSTDNLLPKLITNSIDSVLLNKNGKLKLPRIMNVTRLFNENQETKGSCGFLNFDIIQVAFFIWFYIFDFLIVLNDYYLYARLIYKRIPIV